MVLWCPPTGSMFKSTLLTGSRVHSMCSSLRRLAILRQRLLYTNYTVIFETPCWRSQNFCAQNAPCSWSMSRHESDVPHAGPQLRRCFPSMILSAVSFANNVLEKLKTASEKGHKYLLDHYNVSIQWNQSITVQVTKTGHLTPSCYMYTRLSSVVFSSMQGTISCLKHSHQPHTWNVLPVIYPKYHKLS